MTEKKVEELFAQGYDCSQVVLSYYADALGLDKDTANKVAACFGGGMEWGETCGAVTGSLMAIGLKYGHFKEGDQAQKAIMKVKMAEFKEKFIAQYQSCKCKELLGYDITIPDELEKVLELGIIATRCPKIVKDTIDSLKTVL